MRGIKASWGMVRNGEITKIGRNQDSGISMEHHNKVFTGKLRFRYVVKAAALWKPHRVGVERWSFTFKIEKWKKGRVVLFLAASKKEQWKTKEASSIVSTTGYHSGEGATVTIVGIFYHLFL
jgi:hypothetical protein